MHPDDGRVEVRDDAGELVVECRQQVGWDVDAGGDGLVGGEVAGQLIDDEMLDPRRDGAVLAPSLVHEIAQAGQQDVRPAIRIAATGPRRAGPWRRARSVSRPAQDADHRSIRREQVSSGEAAIRELRADPRFESEAGAADPIQPIQSARPDAGVALWFVQQVDLGIPSVPFRSTRKRVPCPSTSDLGLHGPCGEQHRSRVRPRESVAHPQAIRIRPMPRVREDDPLAGGAVKTHVPGRVGTRRRGGHDDDAGASRRRRSWRGRWRCDRPIGPLPVHDDDLDPSGVEALGVDARDEVVDRLDLSVDPGHDGEARTVDESRRDGHRVTSVPDGRPSPPGVQRW